MDLLGKQIRLKRIFSHPSGRVLTVAVDHLINYPDGLPEGLRDLGGAIRAICAAQPNAITLNKGAARRYMGVHGAGVPFIIQSTTLRGDRGDFESNCTVEEALALGADAIAVAMFVGGPSEMRFVGHLAQVVREADRFGLPVIPHIYPLVSGDEKFTAVHDPEHIHYAVRTGVEMGADVVKVPYTGDAAAFRAIVADAPVPVVTAGGPKCETLEEAAAMLRAIAGTGAAGATVGRNVWGFPRIQEALETLQRALFETPAPAHSGN